MFADYLSIGESPINPSVPDSLICIGYRLGKIGVFRLKKRLGETKEKAAIYDKVLSTRRFDTFFLNSMTSHSPAICSQCQNCGICYIHACDFFFQLWEYCDMQKVPATIYGRKTSTRRFDTIYHIKRSFNLTQSLLKGQSARIWRSDNRGVKKNVWIVSPLNSASAGLISCLT